MSDYARTSLHIEQMDCPTEEALIRKAFEKKPAVKHLHFNLLQRVLTIEYQDGELPDIIKTIQDLGMDVAGQDQNKAKSSKSKESVLLIIAGVLAFGAELLDWFDIATGLSLVLALLAIVLCGTKTYKKGWLSIKQGTLNINALMSIAVTGAFLIGQWQEAAMVMVLYALSEWLEAKSLDRARDAVSKLFALAPETVTVVHDDHSHSKKASLVQIGEHIRIRPGERIALDGEVIVGYSSVNQAPITGESQLVEKKPGDIIYAGSINEGGTLDYKVTALSENSTLARIIHAVEEAQSKQPPIQRFIDRFAAIYTPIVLLIALFAFLLPPVIFNAAWLASLYKALVLLVIACPCALVISTPITVVSALTKAARAGILIKGGQYLEYGRQLSMLAVDKTGTLTQGKPQVTDLKVFTEQPKAVIENLLVNLCQYSQHPVSQAVVRNYQLTENLALSDFTDLVGRGFKAKIAKQQYHLGSPRLMQELGFDLSGIDHLTKLENEGKTIVMLANDNLIIALIAVADRVKPSSKKALQALHALGLKTVMLTGDNSRTAQAIANEVNIDQVLANLLPEDKLNHINHLKQQHVIAMVGDGINDAPALASAQIGIAMGQLGTDIAIETADISLMDDDLQKIPKFIQLSKKTYQILVQNIAFAVGIKVVFLILALMGMATMWMAVFADVGASLIVVLNGLRMLK